MRKEVVMKNIKYLLLFIVVGTFVFSNVNAEEYDDSDYNINTVDETESIDTDEEISTDDSYDDTYDTMENIEETSDEITKSNSLIFVEIFCGLLGLIMIVLSQKTTN
jgi:peptidoglycan hydrolase CwlO-like protein